MGSKHWERWIVLFGATVSLIVSNGPIFLFTFGIFLKPVADEFGWSRGTMTIGLTAGLILGGLATPIIKRVTLAAITVFAASFAAISLTPANVFAFVLLYAVAGFFGGAQAPLPYAKVISGWFESRRGLALGIAMAGVGVGIAIMPQIARAFIEPLGWRNTYAALGAITWLIAFPAVLFFMKDPTVQRSSAAAKDGVPGDDVAATVRGRVFWLILSATLLAVIAMNGVIAHLVALLTDRGVPADKAAPLLAIVGIATIIGRLFSGYLLDRIFAPYLAAGIFLVPLVGMLILLSGMSGPTANIAAAFCFGLGLGAEVDIIGFLVGRYFGLRNYGQIYGYIFAAFTAGSGVGPLLMGYSFDLTRSYQVSLATFAGILFVASVLISRLGPYRYPAEPVLTSAFHR